MQCLRLGLFVRFVAFKAILLSSANPLSNVLSMPTQCKIIANDHKIILTQTLKNHDWKNHQNFSYCNNNLISPNATQPQPAGFQYRAPYAPPPQQQQPPQPKSNLESLIERFIVTQTKTNKALGESASQLASKFETMTTYQKMMENQIAQIAQQVSHLSRPQGYVSG